MSNEQDLLPCPFCDCSSINDWQIDEDVEDEYRAGKYYVACDFCHAQTSLFTDEKAAMEAWNNRTNTGYESGKRAERLRIVKELRAIRDEARNDAQEYRVNLTELIDSLEKGEEK